jgi:hypothetical protein
LAQDCRQKLFLDVAVEGANNDLCEAHLFALATLLRSIIFVFDLHSPSSSLAYLPFGGTLMECAPIFLCRAGNRDHYQLVAPASPLVRGS